MTGPATAELADTIAERAEITPNPFDWHLASPATARGAHQPRDASPVELVITRTHDGWHWHCSTTGHHLAASDTPLARACDALYVAELAAAAHTITS